MENNSIRNIIALSLIKGVGSAFIKKNFFDIKRNKNNLLELSKLGGKVDLNKLEEELDESERIINECKNRKIGIITITDDNYPRNLFEIKDPPPILYYLGNITLLNKAIAIIGTRKSSELGNRIANRLGLYFSKNWSICNGLVDGIDKNSIINDNNVHPRVIGVLSGGLNYQYTSSKITQELSIKVLENDGLLLSENEPSKKEDQFSAIKASRIQAGLSNLLLLVQSSIEGGSRYTVKTFSELQRPLGIIDFSEEKSFREDERFEANRLILEKRKKGIMEFCNIKKIENIKIFKTISIKNNNDYLLIEEEIKASKNTNWSLGDW
jgi:DNA processing protein